jgi:hypothetical protein
LELVESMFSGAEKVNERWECGNDALMVFNDLAVIYRRRRVGGDLT